VKILKPGNPGQTSWAKEYTCTGAGNGGGGCGAVLLVEKDDVFVTASHCRDETDYFNTFKCAQCGVRTDIKESLPFTPRAKRPDE
jgi:hypothetical protein